MYNHYYNHKHMKCLGFPKSDQLKCAAFTQDKFEYLKLLPCVLETLDIPIGGDIDTASIRQIIDK
jgi:hypothetical protein